MLVLVLVKVSQLEDYVGFSQLGGESACDHGRSHPTGAAPVVGLVRLEITARVRRGRTGIRKARRRSRS